jgi:hypothetical protein
MEFIALYSNCGLLGPGTVHMGTNILEKQITFIFRIEFQPKRWWQYVPSKHAHPPIGLHSVHYTNLHHSKSQTSIQFYTILLNSSFLYCKSYIF